MGRPTAKERADCVAAAHGKPERGRAVSVLMTNKGTYRASGAGIYCDDESFRIKGGDSWPTPESTEDRYVEYGIAREEN
jgi:hypothetical protein